ncbi:MAG: polyprenol monophosphomannose synthase [Actinomycetota bacterium]
MPTYNEVASLEKTISDVFLHNPSVEILVVDDSSPDGTYELAHSISKLDSRVHTLLRKSKEGLGPAYLAGFSWGLGRDYEFIIEMDADGSHRGEDLTKLLAVANNFDLVIGSRWVSGGAVVNWPLHRKLISRIGNFYARKMLGTSIRDMTAGFRCFRAGFLRQLELENISSAGYSFQVELAYKAFQNGVIGEVPITFVERLEGKSKMTLAIVLEALTKVTSWGLKRKKS